MNDKANRLTISVLPSGLDHPEGVAWGPDSRVYAGGEAGQVYRINLADNACEAYANTGGFVLGPLSLDPWSVRIVGAGRVAMSRPSLVRISIEESGLTRSLRRPVSRSWWWPFVKQAGTRLAISVGPCSPLRLNPAR